MPSSKKLRISGPARHDLERIGEYTGAEWGAAQRRKYLGQIKDGFKAVRDAPGIGTRRDDIGTGLRAQSVQKHVIFYRVTKSEVMIVRVLHESMNPELHLKPKRGKPKRGDPKRGNPKRGRTRGGSR